MNRPPRLVPDPDNLRTKIAEAVVAVAVSELGLPDQGPHKLRRHRREETLSSPDLENLHRDWQARLNGRLPRPYTIRPDNPRHPNYHPPKAQITERGLIWPGPMEPGTVIRLLPSQIFQLVSQAGLLDKQGRWRFIVFPDNKPEFLLSPPSPDSEIKPLTRRYIDVLWPIWAICTDWGDPDHQPWRYVDSREAGCQEAMIALDRDCDPCDFKIN